MSFNKDAAEKVERFQLGHFIPEGVKVENPNDLIFAELIVYTIGQTEYFDIEYRERA